MKAGTDDRPAGATVHIDRQAARLGLSASEGDVATASVAARRRCSRATGALTSWCACRSLRPDIETLARPGADPG